MIGRNTGQVRLDASTMELLSEIERKDTNTAEYFSQFLIPGALKSDDGWFNPKMLAGNCSCSDEQLYNLGSPCNVCKCIFAANRIATNYEHHMTLKD